MVKIAAEKGMTVTAEEVRGLLRHMDAGDEFDVSIELDAVVLTAIAWIPVAGYPGTVYLRKRSCLMALPRAFLRWDAPLLSPDFKVLKALLKTTVTRAKKKALNEESPLTLLQNFNAN